MKSPKNRLGKVVGILIDKLRKLYMNGTERSSRNFQPSSSYRKFQAIFASPNRYFRKNSRWVPLNKYKLAVPKPHTEFYKRSLSRSGNVLWNSLTLEVRQLTSLYVFKGKLKDLNLEICNIFTYWPLCKQRILHGRAEIRNFSSRVFQHKKRNFVSPSGHVMFYLLYKHQRTTKPFHFNSSLM